MNAPSTVVGRGAVAGLAGAVGLAAWFLIIDLIAGEAFRTPAYMASLIGVGDGTAFGILGIIIYTVLHFAVWIAVGIGVALLLDRVEVAPIALLGLVLGFLLFDLMFYGSLVITGVDVMRALGWPQMLVGNLIGGVAVLTALALMGHVEPLGWNDLMARHLTIREGLITGAIGAVAVALWFLAVDLMVNRVLWTPAALGSALFYGARSPADVRIDAITVLGYTVIHIAAFLLTGIIAAVIVAAAEQISEALLLGGIVLFVTFEAFSIGLLAIIFSWLVDSLSWWNIAGANLIAAVGMGAYLWHAHPQLMHDVTDHDLEEDMAQEVPAPHQQPYW
jgi:hypothetical protein